MPKTFLLFAFVLLMASSGIVQASAQITKLERLTAFGCERTYPLQDSQDLKKVFGPKWKRLFKVNPGLEDRILFGGSVLQKLYSDDRLCLPPGLNPIPADAANPNEIRPDQIYNNETVADAPAAATTQAEIPQAQGEAISVNEEAGPSTPVIIILLGVILGLGVLAKLFGFLPQTNSTDDIEGTTDIMEDPNSGRVNNDWGRYIGANNLGATIPPPAHLVAQSEKPPRKKEKGPNPFREPVPGSGAVTPGADLYSGCFPPMGRRIPDDEDPDGWDGFGKKLEKSTSDLSHGKLPGHLGKRILN